MNLEKVVFGFFIIFALTLNFGFFIGDSDNQAYHNIFELFAALIVSMIATVLKFGDRTHIGALLLATSLVADLHLILAAITWAWFVHIKTGGMAVGDMTTVVSLAGGAMIANGISVVLLVAETLAIRR